MSEEKLTQIRDIMIEFGELYPEYGETIPASWMSLHEAICRLKREGQKIATLEEIHHLNKQLNHPMAADELKLSLLFFHEIGYILYFADITLQSFIILDPKVVIDAMKCIITCPHFMSKIWGSWNGIGWSKKAGFKGSTSKRFGEMKARKHFISFVNIFCLRWKDLISCVLRRCTMKKETTLQNHFTTYLA